jgi:hypothetical protein
MVSDAELFDLAFNCMLRGKLGKYPTKKLSCERNCANKNVALCIDLPFRRAEIFLPTSQNPTRKAAKEEIRPVLAPFCDLSRPVSDFELLPNPRFPGHGGPNFAAPGAELFGNWIDQK